MRRVEFGGTLFLVAVIGVLLTSREEGDKSSKAACGLIHPSAWKRNSRKFCP
jgi:hypothetical protein